MSINPPPAQPSRLHHHVLRIVSPPLAHLHHRRYHGHPWHLAADTVLNILIWAMLAGALALILIRTGTNIPKVQITPAEMVSGQETQLQVTVTAPSDTRLRQADVMVHLPNGWTSISNLDWDLGTVESGAAKSSTFTVLPLGQPDDRVPVRLALRWQANGAVIETKYSQNVRLVDSVYGLTVTAPAEVAAGQTWAMTSVVKSPPTPTGNQLSLELVIPTGVEIVSADPVLEERQWDIDPATLSDKTFVVQLRMTVQRQTVVRVGAKIVATAAGQAWTQITRTTDVTVGSTGGGEVVTEPAARPSFAAEARYHSVSGQQFGYGPFPPKIGQETVYRLFWYVRPGQSTVNSAGVTMSLPPNVRWVGHQSLSGGQSIRYDAVARRVTWSIGDLAANGQPMVASFDVGITPTAAERGRTVRLANAASLTYTGGKIVTSALTTANVDGGAGRNGLVQ